MIVHQAGDPSSAIRAALLEPCWTHYQVCGRRIESPAAFMVRNTVSAIAFARSCEMYVSCRRMAAAIRSSSSSRFRGAKEESSDILPGYCKSEHKANADRLSMHSRRRLAQASSQRSFKAELGWEAGARR